MPIMSGQKRDFRDKLNQELIFFAEKHPEQKITADKMREFIQRRPDCFERSCLEGHITGSAWLVNEREDKALLTLHHKLKRWMQTGGHADGNQNPLQAALREAEEESGISGITPISTDIFDIDIHRIPARPDKGEPEHWHYDIRYLLKAPHEQFTISPESDDLAWWHATDFSTRIAETDVSVQRMAKRFFG